MSNQTWTRIKRGYYTRTVPGGVATVFRRASGEWAWRVETGGVSAHPDDAMRAADAVVPADPSSGGAT